MKQMAHTPLENAKWIGGSADAVSPVVIRHFQADRVKKAVLYVTGLGYFKAKINDRAVSEDRFIPVVSDYEPRRLEQFFYPLHDSTTHGIYYYTYDVTQLLCQGENMLTIWLGNGWYRQTERDCEGKVSFGTALKTIYSLVMETENGDCTICSDGSETWKNSEIVYSNLYIGERIDPFVDSAEQRAVIYPAPETELRPAIGVTDRVIRRLRPKVLGKIDGRLVFDAGENVSGVVRICASAPKGEHIRLRFAENIQSDLNLDFRSSGAQCMCSTGRPQIMMDEFVSDGTSRSFEPEFVWHAFRYFDVEGAFDQAEVLVIHSDTAVTAEFDSSSEGLNFLMDAFLRTQLDNMHGSIPSDCPHRERLGYTGDGQICAPAAMMLLDCQEFYRKWIQDILDCQDQRTGHVQHTAPLLGGGGGPGGWGCAIVLVPYAYYKQYGDIEILKTCYEPMRRWMDYLASRSEDGLVVQEEMDGWCLGDWCTLEKIQIPEPFVNTCYLLKCLKLMCEIAALTGHQEHVSSYEHWYTEAAGAVKKNYYDTTCGHYCENKQGADAFAVWAGLAEGREAADLVSGLAAFYDELGHFDTGIFGTDILMELLLSYGYADTALNLLESEAEGSYLYMKRHGATTLWETWSGDASHNHPMFGSCVRQLFTGFLGIHQKEGTAGYTDVEITPQIPEKLQFIKGSICTQQGKIEVVCERKDGEIQIRTTMPEEER